MTSFDRLAVTRVREAPGASRTFVRRVEVFGSDRGAKGVWTRLATGKLTAREAP